MVLLRITDDEWEIIKRKKWVISPKRLAVSNDEWTQYKREKITSGAKLETIKRYERDRKRFLRLLKLIKEEKAKIGPKERVKEVKEKPKKFHKTHIFVFKCRVPYWSDFSQIKEHYVGYRVVKDEPADEQIAYRLHKENFPEHVVLDYWYYGSIKVAES